MQKSHGSVACQIAHVPTLVCPNLRTRQVNSWEVDHVSLKGNRTTKEYSYGKFTIMNT